MNQISEQSVLDALTNIIDPDLRKDIVTLGFVKDLEIAGGAVSFRKSGSIMFVSASKRFVLIFDS